MVPILAVGLKFTGALVPGKFGICGLIRPLTIMDRLSVLGLFEDLLIYK
jgi:hypothetical protein